MATTHPCVCTCTCAWPRAASGTCSQQLGKPHPTCIRWGRGHRAVSTQRTTPSYMVGSSGKIRAVVVWKEVFQSWSLRGTYCKRCGQSRAYLGKDILPCKHPRKRRGSYVLEQPPKQWSVIQSALPTQQHHKPRELQLQSTKQPGSGQLGRASGPGRTYYSSP